VTFIDRSTAEKFMYGLNNGEIPSAGKVELSWVQTPLPPITLPNKAAIAVKPDNNDGMQVDQADEIVHAPSPMNGSGNGHEQHQQQQQQELDYDYADDNDWAQ
jgi:RNA-binding protein 26